MTKHLIIATRGSALALWQAEYVKNLLQELDPSLNISFNIIKTKGDIFLDVPLSKVGGKGLFVKEIEEALLDGRADLAVHSMKDVPMILPNGLILGCMPKRASYLDCMLSCKYPSFYDLPQNAHIGTSSLRRQAQLLSLRPDLKISNLRGNVNTRLKKLMDNEFDAIILAKAGIDRLNLDAPYLYPIDKEIMLPAPGQGAIGIECRENDLDLLIMFSELEDRMTRVCVDAERGFLRGLEGGCQVPIAGFAEMLNDETIHLKGLVAEINGSKCIMGNKEGDASNAEKIGLSLADELLKQGAKEILQKLYQQTN